MNDPKYTPTNAGIVHEDGYTVPLDEPCMIFRGKDIGSLSAIVDYITMLEEQQISATVVSHLKSSGERLQAFYDYQCANPDLQSVGCSRRQHSQSALFLSLAHSKLLEMAESGYMGGLLCDS